jgi:hypothetical protein
VPHGAKSFYNAKIEAAGAEGLQAEGNYTNGNILSVGTNMGAKIIGDLSIRNVGLNFNIEKLLNSSWSIPI